MSLKEKNLNTKFKKDQSDFKKSNALVSTKIVRKKKIKIGDICVLKISALGPKGIGIDEYSYGYSIFVPNVNLGDIIKAKIIKTSNLGENTSSKLVNNSQQYAVAKVLENSNKQSTLSKNLTIKPDQILTVNIEKFETSNSNSKGNIFA